MNKRLWKIVIVGDLLFFAGLLAIIFLRDGDDSPKSVRELIDARARQSLYPMKVDQTSTEADFTAPERTAASSLSAMYTGDKERFLSCMTEAWRKEQLEGYELAGSFEEDHERTKESRKAAWLVGEIVYDDAVFVLMVFSRTDAWPFHLPLPMVPIGDGEWKLTLRFSSEPRFKEAMKKAEELMAEIPELAEEQERWASEYEKAMKPR